MYDVNGNLQNDPYKNMTLYYNVLNKTDEIDFAAVAGKSIKYVYSADGAVLQKIANDGTTTTTTAYIDGFEYVNGTLSFFPMPEGRVVNNGGNLTPQYIVTDNQGNERITFNNTAPGNSAKVIQENSYYGFGMVMPGSTVTTPAPPNKNLYNGGSEWQNDFSILPDLMQTFYRNYDATLGRFAGVDPIAESAENMSSYQYSGNNPIMGYDPWGDKPLAPEPSFDINEYAQWVAAQGNLGVYGWGGSGGGGWGPGGYDPIGNWAAVETSPEYQQYLSDLTNLDVEGRPSATQVAAVLARQAADVAAGAGGTPFGLAATINDAIQGFSSLLGNGGTVSYSANNGVKITYQSTGDYAWLEGEGKFAPGEIIKIDEGGVVGKVIHLAAGGAYNTSNLTAVADANAYPAYDGATCGKCATNVRVALEGAHINTKGHSVSAKDYGPLLIREGFEVISPVGYKPQKGDIRVWQPAKGGSQHGHIDIWDGSNWVSDFIENSDYPGRKYRADPHYQIYRWKGK
jgi:RHS repeat-associated protein